MPKVFDKTTYKEWIDSGKKTVIDKAKQRYEEITATHKPKPLTEAVSYTHLDVYKRQRL